MASLPQEIIEEILSRVLKVKSQLRFRCVSKSWCSLVSNKEYIKSHLKKSLKNAISYSDQDIITIWDRSLHLKLQHKKYYLYPLNVGFLTNKDLENIETNIAASLFLSVYGSSKWSWFVGCSNGLSCLFIFEHIFLWNPCTRQSYLLPYHYPLESIWLNCRVDSIGFGFDESNDDYKVVVQYIEYDNYSDMNKYLITLYNLKTNTWKILKKIIGQGEDIDEKLLARDLDKSGKLLHRKLHWGSSNTETWEILSFDLSTDVFGLVEKPSYEVNNRSWIFEAVDVVKECLCFLNECRSERWLDIWIMKEYGIKESWSKAFRLHYDQDLPLYQGFKPLLMTEDLEILYVKQNTFIFYDPKTDSVRNPKANNPKNKLRRGDTRIQSLVSPFPDGGFKASPWFVAYMAHWFKTTYMAHHKISFMSKVRCYNCNRKGHYASGCRKVRCYNCHQQGHYARDCTESKKGKCYNCHQEGHYARDCR